MKATFYHVTNSKPFKKFKTSLVWCDTVPRDYGENEALLEYNIEYGKVFCTHPEAGDYPELNTSNEQGTKNRQLYEALGGEVSKKPFRWARRQGYTAIFDIEGWCLLIPAQVKIVSWYEVKGELHTTN